jgi:hypothetical protein
MHVQFRTAAPLSSAVLALSLAFAAAPAHAQMGASGVLVRRLDPPQSNLPAPTVGTPRAQSMSLGVRPAILLTGYWPPSNEAVRRFSPDPVQNPQGWLGSNWEGRGYDIYAYFPEFSPPNCTSCGTGSGDLMVDYQDTSADFWPIANALQPIAVMTFSRSSSTLNWEVEMNQYNRASWVNDYVAPVQPTPAPPDASVPAGTLRLSTLPVQEIVDDVNDANAGLNSFVCLSGNGGGFVSEFIAYHGVWYQALHASSLDPAWCVAAGHIHVGRNIPWTQAQRAAEISLRTLLRHVDRTLGRDADFDLYCETASNSAGLGAMLSPLGTASIGANDLGWTVNYAPASVNGFLFYGAGQATTPYGAGTLCVAAPRQRVPPVLATDASGALTRIVDLNLAPFGSGPSAVLAGSTWHFQFAYRDPTGAANGLNATNGVSVVFAP